MGAYLKTKTERCLGLFWYFSLVTVPRLSLLTEPAHHHNFCVELLCQEHAQVFTVEVILCKYSRPILLDRNGYGARAGTILGGGPPHGGVADLLFMQKVTVVI